MKKRMLKTKIISMILLCFTLLIFSNTVISKAAGVDFNGSQQSYYTLSNGENIRIEYHGGKPHVHDSQGSMNLNDGTPHHNDGRLPKKSTRKIVNGEKKAKNNSDKKAQDKAKQLKQEWEKAEQNAKNASKKFIKKNKIAIRDANNASKVVVIIGGIVYALWQLLQLMSQYGIPL